MSKSKKPTNRNWLKKFLGTDASKSVDKLLSNLSETLDNANVQKKATHMASQKGVIENMQSDIAKILGKYIDNPDPELINEVIAVAISSMLPSSDEPLDNELEDTESFEPEEEFMINDEDEDEDEDGKKAFYKAYRNTHTHLSSIAKDVREQNETLSGLMELFIELASSMKGMNDKVSVIEKKVNAQPRRAGENTNGIVHDEKVTTEMKKASVQDEYDSFWGLPKSVLKRDR